MTAAAPPRRKRAASTAAQEREDQVGRAELEVDGPDSAANGDAGGGNPPIPPPARRRRGYGGGDRPSRWQTGLMLIGILLLAIAIAAFAHDELNKLLREDE
jgi:hypothetical protein